MSDLTAVDILIQPDTATIERAREVNRRMPLSIPAGITLDDTHLPHITMLQRYLNTADLERAYAAITAVVANTDTAALSYHVPGIAYSEDWGPPGQAVAVLEVRPGPQVLDLQAALLAAVRPFTGSGGTDAAFVTDPGQQINPKTKDWVETFEPNQIGANYTAHLTVGFATVTDLKALQTQPFDEFDVQPVGLAVYHLGNNGTARSRLKNGPLTPETNSDHRSELACGQGHLGGFEVVSSVSDLSSFWGCRRRCQRRGELGDASSVNDVLGRRPTRCDGRSWLQGVSGKFLSRLRAVPLLPR